MAPIGPEPPGANLPAPYRSPWLVLAGDLVAVGADIGLRCRELWRRNRHGQLPCPRFWPASLAASFWPLLLVGAVALLGAGLWVGVRPGASPAAAPPGLIASGASSNASPGLAPVVAEPQVQAQSQPSPQPELGPLAPALGSSGAPSKTVGASPGPGASPGSAPPGSPPASGSETLQPLEGDGVLMLELPPIEPDTPDPLQSWRQRPEAAGLLVQVGGDPGTSRIQLVLGDAFGQLRASEQQQRADLWLAWAQDWGYDHLELRGLGGSLLGREARVGGGMILGFSP